MLLNFKKLFKPKIENGSKIFTIRNPRKIDPKIGETIYMYTGLRTKNSQFITSEHTSFLIGKIPTEFEGKKLYPIITKSAK